MTSTVVFTRTKHKARSLAVQLEKAGYSAAALQGNMSQSKRQKAMDGFRDGTFSVLVATDIAARGIDVAGISHVINYDMPDTPETYTHRTGRTGRASLSGQAISFASQEDNKMVALIERNLGKKMQRDEIADFTLQRETAGPARRNNRPFKKTTKKNTTSNGPKKSRRRAVSFDFGVNK